MTSNPMSEASKAGLLKRMHADKADTFAKKVKWVSKHIPTITDPQAYVGWLTKEERMSKRNPSPEKHLQYALEQLGDAEEDFKRAQAEATSQKKLSGLLSAFSSASQALSNAVDAEDKHAIDRSHALRQKVNLAIHALFKGKGKAKATPKAKNPKRTSDHNYVVCDKNGKAVALTTTLAEARKIAPKGGCVEKL